MSKETSSGASVDGEINPYERLSQNMSTEILYPSYAGIQLENISTNSNNSLQSVETITKDIEVSNALPSVETITQDIEVSNVQDDEPFYSEINKPTRSFEHTESKQEDCDADKKSLSCSIDDAIYDNPDVSEEDSHSHSSILSVDSGDVKKNGFIVARDQSSTIVGTTELLSTKTENDDDIYSSIDEFSEKTIGEKTVPDSQAVITYDSRSAGINNASPVLPPKQKNLEQGGLAVSSPANKKQQFKVRYLGSMPISEESMKGEKSSQAVRKCIVYLSVESPGDIDALHEWSTELKMLLSLEDNSLTIKNAQDGTSLISHNLNRIRVWGTGKEANSPIFAYVTRSKTSDSFVCRVLHCEDCKAQSVAGAIRAICEAKARKKESPNPTKSVTVTNGATLASNSSSRSTTTIAASSSAPKETIVSILCKYVGSFDVTESDAGKQDTDTIVSTLCSSKKSKEWPNIIMDISPSTIRVKDSEKQSVVHMECQTSCLTYCGIYIKSNKFGSFNVQTRPNEYISHVFYCEPTAHVWFMNIQAICKTSMDLSSDKRGQTNKRGLLKNFQRIFVQQKSRLGSQ